MSRAEGARRHRRSVLAAALVLVVVLVAGLLAWWVSVVRAGGGAGGGPWQPRFPAGRSLISNEFAYRNPQAADAHRSPDWIVTSGSLFADDGAAWSGPVDGGSPGPSSEAATGSAVLRAVSVRDDFGDVVVSLGLNVARLTTTRRAGENSFDGVHLLLRYTNPDSLYAVSLCRRDGAVVVKRKEFGTRSDDGYYTTLAQASSPCPVGQWTDYSVSVQDEPGGVRLTMSVGSRIVLSVLDDGQGGAAPLRGTGRVGVRGDNTEFRLRDLAVRPYR